VTSKEHKKHANIRRPSGGLFHRNELAILGAPCGIIQRLAADVAKQLSGKFNIGYVDADHGEASSGESPFHTAYTDKISFHQINWKDLKPEYRFRKMFHDSDALLVNGNHFKAASQIVIVNAKKEGSLQRKLDRLTKVQLVVLDEGMRAPFDFLSEAIHGVPVLRIDQTDEIVQVIKGIWDENVPALKGLVLAGGKSTRMGKDKGAISYFGKPQRDYAADLLGHYCDEVFLSAREPGQFESDYSVLPDTFTDLGPFGGILSAFRMNPDAAWLTVACDQPLLDKEVLNQLVQSRDTSSMATCFHNPETGFPEPLLTIWEPRAYQALLEFMALGYSCPRKALINTNVREVVLQNPEGLINVNTPEELTQMKARLDG
jgi:molybdopterin-guanine dinucleotide biosynthesis protein A